MSRCCGKSYTILKKSDGIKVIGAVIGIKGEIEGVNVALGSEMALHVRLGFCIYFGM
jgi:hypothetical protein